jgi:muramoyltetrapeptide carboxypeptidase LdcA involved in peptidoglycan recycling
MVGGVEMVDVTEVAFYLQAELLAAQSELAALREELAEANIEVGSQRHFRESAEQLLTSAEQRNAELVELLRDCRLRTIWPSDLTARIDAALKPTESGASE